jgi:hypothetical protein
MWHGEALHGLGVQGVEVLILLGALFLPCVAQHLSKSFDLWSSHCLLVHLSCLLGSSYTVFYNRYGRQNLTYIKRKKRIKRRKRINRRKYLKNTDHYFPRNKISDKTSDRESAMICRKDEDPSSDTHYGELPYHKT